MGKKIIKTGLVVLFALIASLIIFYLLMQTGIAVFIVDSLMIKLGLLRNHTGYVGEIERSRSEINTFIFILAMLFSIVFISIFLLFKYLFSNKNKS